MNNHRSKFTPIPAQITPKVKVIQRDFKSCSTSNIFLDSTITKPNVKLMIKAVATILQSQLNEDMNLGKQISPKSDLYYFSEDKYVDEYPQYFDKTRIENIRKVPTLDDMINFIEALYNCVQFSSECCIISLIYINRIIALTGLSLQTTNWRPMVFVSLMISQKIWDDKYLSNGDFSYIYPFFEKNQNYLESYCYPHSNQYDDTSDRPIQKEAGEFACRHPHLLSLSSEHKAGLQFVTCGHFSVGSFWSPS